MSRKGSDSLKGFYYQNCVATFYLEELLVESNYQMPQQRVTKVCLESITIEIETPDMLKRKPSLSYRQMPSCNQSFENFYSTLSNTSS